MSAALRLKLKSRLEAARAARRLGQPEEMRRHLAKARELRRQLRERKAS